MNSMPFRQLKSFLKILIGVQYDSEVPKGRMAMNKIWIGNGQLVLPDKIVPGGSVLLEGKKIAAVNVPCPPDARRVDVDGSYIMAGFVELIPIPGTRNHKKILLTASGQALADRTVNRLKEAEQRAYSRMSEEDLQTYLELTSRLTSHFREETGRLIQKKK